MIVTLVFYGKRKEKEQRTRLKKETNQYEYGGGKAGTNDELARLTVERNVWLVICVWIVQLYQLRVMLSFNKLHAEGAKLIPFNPIQIESIIPSFNLMIYISLFIELIIDHR